MDICLWRGPCSPLLSGESSALLLQPGQASRLNSTPRQLVSPRRWRKPSAAWCHRISDPGPDDSYRWNILICPSPSLQLASLCFSMFMGTNDQSFPPWIRKCPTGQTWFKLELPSVCRQLLCYIGHPKSRLSFSQPSWLKGVALI